MQQNVLEQVLAPQWKLTKYFMDSRGQSSPEINDAHPRLDDIDPFDWLARDTTPEIILTHEEEAEQSPATENQ